MITDIENRRFRTEEMNGASLTHKKEVIKMLSRFLKIIALAALILVPATGHQPLHAQEPSAIRVWGGTPTGAWGPMMINISEKLKKAFPGVPVSAEPAGGSSAILGVAREKGELCIAVSFTAAKAYFGKPPFKQAEKNLRLLATLFDSPMQITVLERTGIRKIEDLKGKRINFGRKGFNSDILGQTILKEYGININDVKPQYLGLGAGSVSMKNGQTDASFRGTAIPTADIIDLSNARKINQLSIDDDVIDRILAKYPGLTRSTIPAGTYKGVERPVKTISAPAVFLVQAKTPDDVVYKILQTVIENRDTLIQVYAPMKQVTPEKMTTEIGIPFHPGAIKYYKEKGYLK